MNEIFKDNIDYLRAAIVLQAVKDYLTALKAKDKGKIQALENFFYSERFEELTDGKYNASDVIKRLRTMKSDKVIQQKRKGDSPRS